MSSGMPWNSAEHHVWVRPLGNHGETLPGLVICWQHAPVRNALASPLVALVVTVPFGTTMHMGWVGGERLVPVRDPKPREVGSGAG